MSYLLKWAFYGISAIVLSPFSQALIVGSYNIRYLNEGDVAKGNGWEQRLPVIAGLIRFHDFDIIGTQEAYGTQVRDLQKLLPDFEFRGVGRDDGKDEGEYAAIFYKKSKFSVLNSGTFWLSATPTVPSIGWDAERSRICTWAKFKALGGNETFFVFNTHFDHRGKESRAQSARLMLQAIRTIAGNEKSLMMGDFNFDQSSLTYQQMLDGGVLFDSFTTSTDCYALTGTTNGFTINTKSDNRIDHIFHTKHFKPRRYGILTDSYRVATEHHTESSMAAFPVEVKFKNYEARLPSDHFPVLVEFE